MPADDEIVSIEATPAGITETSIRGAIVNLNFLINPEGPPGEDVPADS